MRKHILLTVLLACLMLVSGAQAQAMWPPEAVWQAAQARYPGYGLSIWARPDSGGGRHALALTKDKHSVLMLLEEEAGGVSLLFACDHPVKPDAKVTELRFQGEHTLFWQSPTPEAVLTGMMDNSAMRYSALLGPGGWRLSAVERLTGMNREVITHAGGMLMLYDEGPAYDEPLRVLSPLPYAPGDTLMDDFDARSFPHDRGEAEQACLPYLPGRLIGADERANKLSIDTHIYTEVAGPQGRRVHISRWIDEEGRYEQIISAPLTQGVSADIFHSSGDGLGLYLDSGENYASFTKGRDGRYRLSAISLKGDDSIRIREHMIGGCDQAGEERYLYGRLPDWDITSIDYAAIPRSFKAAVALVDSSGWALVSPPAGDDRLHLRQQPDEASASLGSYLSGAPVQILSRQGDWAQVDVAGVRGYMMAAYLAVGKSMLTVPRREPENSQLEEALRYEWLPLYELPDSQAPSFRVEGRFLDWGRVHILGEAGENWYHVQLDDGSSGYVRQDLYWPGNG